MAQKNTDRDMETEQNEKQKLIETGISGLDLQLNGGIPQGSTILLLGKPGSGTEIFGQQFISSGLRNQEKAWYFVTRDPPSQIQKEMKNFGWETKEYIKKGDFEIVDGYVGRFIGALPPEKLKSLAKKKDLRHGTDVSSKLQDYITNIRSDTQVRGIIDSISDFISQYGIEKVSNLIKLLSSVNRALNAITLVLMTKGMHQKKIENEMKHNSDIVIELSSSKRGNEIERELLIEKVKGRVYPSKIIPYSITEKGIEVQTTERVA